MTTDSSVSRLGDDTGHSVPPAEIAPGWGGPCTLGGVTAFASLILSLATMVALVLVGGTPETAEEAFEILEADRLTGLLRLELLSLMNVGVYYLTFFGLYTALRRSDPARATLATVLVFAGVTLWLSSHSMLSLVTLSERYADATTEARRVQLLAAGEALMASDMWHSTSAIVGGLLVEVGAVLISIVMLRTNVFSRTTAWVGLITHGLDLTQIVGSQLIPSLSVVVMAVAGPLYLVWFALIGRRLLRLGREAPPGRV